MTTAFTGPPCVWDYFGFLHCWEFTVPDGQAFDSSVHLAVGDVVNSGLCLAGISVHIKATKTKPAPAPALLFGWTEGISSLHLLPARRRGN